MHWNNSKNIYKKNTLIKDWELHWNFISCKLIYARESACSEIHVAVGLFQIAVNP